MALAANSQGQVTGRFMVPPGVPTGSKLVTFTGAGGSHGSATFVARGQITIRELRRTIVEHEIITHHLEAYDPLAETFTLAAPAFLSSVDLKFCAKGTSGTTLVQIRGTGNGVPNQEVLAEAAVPTASLTLNQWYRFRWAPTRFEAGVEYALVIGCDDATTAVQVAELGKFDAIQQRWVTSQPYQVGVLLSSSNLSTWTPHQDRDLTFRLNATPLAATTHQVAVGTTTMTGVDELVVLAAVERPTEDCDCLFTIGLPNGAQVQVPEGEIVLLPATMTGTFSLAATLTGTTSATPRLHRDVTLVGATRAPTGKYRSRAVTAGTGSKVSVYFEQNLPGTSTCLVEVSPNGTTGWSTVPVVAQTNLGSNWYDITDRLNTWNNNSAFIRVTLSGTAQMRPQIRKFRVVVT